MTLWTLDAYRDANNTTDWIASFVTKHLEGVLWIDVAIMSVCAIP